MNGQIPGAIALPVQMLESWLLLMHDPVRYQHESVLPACAWRDRDAARRLYGPNPPPQLKDLVDEAQRTTGDHTKAGFALDCIVRFDPMDLAARSPSFDRFRSEVMRWTGR